MSARRHNSGVGVALLGLSAAAMISAFAFLLLPKFMIADRHSLPPITVDLFLPERGHAASASSGVVSQVSAPAKHHGLADLGDANQSKLSVGAAAGSGVKPPVPNGHS